MSPATSLIFPEYEEYNYIYSEVGKILLINEKLWA